MKKVLVNGCITAGLAFILAAPMVAGGATETLPVTSPHIEACQANVTTHLYRRGDTGFDKAAVS